MNKVAFIGHREIFSKEIYDKLKNCIENEIKKGNKFFTMGTHGQFDSLALSACKILRRTYSDVEIEVVITSLNAIKKYGKYDNANYFDVKTVMYDIENAHFKQQIILSNKQMIDNCDTLICYVNEKKIKSGAKIILNYAKRKGLKIINLFCEEDDNICSMTKENLLDYFDNILNNKK